VFKGLTLETSYSDRLLRCISKAVAKSDY